ncbi:hypothetical protein P7C73_g6299, partial [Tremellales sp. Uapishka_1]
MDLVSQLISAYSAFTGTKKSRTVDEAIDHFRTQAKRMTAFGATDLLANKLGVSAGQIEDFARAEDHETARSVLISALADRDDDHAVAALAQRMGIVDVADLLLTVRSARARKSTAGISSGTRSAPSTDGTSGCSDEDSGPSFKKPGSSLDTKHRHSTFYHPWSSGSVISCY